MSGFFAWIEQGGGYAAGFATFIVSVIAIIAGCVKAYHYITSPVHEARKASEQGDAELHERIDSLETESKQCAKKFANDDEAIKSLRRDSNRHADNISMLTDGVFLIVQHLVTKDHIEDMQEWMRDYTKQTVKSDIGS